MTRYRASLLAFSRDSGDSKRLGGYEAQPLHMLDSLLYSAVCLYSVIWHSHWGGWGLAPIACPCCRIWTSPTEPWAKETSSLCITVRDFVIGTKIGLRQHPYFWEEYYTPWFLNVKIKLKVVHSYPLSSYVAKCIHYQNSILKGISLVGCMVGGILCTNVLYSLKWYPLSENLWYLEWFLHRDSINVRKYSGAGILEISYGLLI